MSSLAKPWAAVLVLVALVAMVPACRESSLPAPITGNSAPPSDSGAMRPSPPALPETGDLPALAVGSAAPPVTIAQWLTGEPIERFEPGQVYVVEFWATWCGPCRLSMPHLGQLQQQYGDKVKFVGVTQEPETTVREFLAKEQSPGKTWAEVVNYRLATDSAASTNEAYMTAAGQVSIPTAFIVGKDSVVEWVGRPLLIDEPLAKVTAGTWDRQAAAVEFRQKQRLQQLSRDLRAKLKAEQWDEALGMVDRLEQEMGPSGQLTRIRLSVLQQAGQAEEAAELQAELLEQLRDDAMALHEIAWEIACKSGTDNLDLAMKAAERASEIRNHEDATILDTLARVCYKRGRLDQAIQWQKKAVERNHGDSSLNATLKKYETEEAVKSGDLTAPTEKDPAKPEKQGGASR